VHYGNASRGLGRAPQQLRVNASTPVGPHGRSDEAGSIRVALRGRSPAGRERVRLAWESAPLGTPFGGGGISRGALFDTGAPQALAGSFVILSDVEDGLATPGNYIWRARIEGRSPFFPRAPWVSPPFNAARELDFRSYSALTTVEGPRAEDEMRLVLEPNRPEPFREATRFAFTLPYAAHVRFTIHDVQGRRVAELLAEPREAGRHAVEWKGTRADGGRVAAGVYFARLDAGGRIASRTIIRVD
jgi:hypothetical protein